MRSCFFLLFLVLAVVSCGPSRTLSRSARKGLLAEMDRAGAHTGITLYEPATGRYWYDHDGDKYFVPASNVKIATCYAALKYLGDSLPGIKYGYSEAGDPNSVILALQPTGDPTLMHRDFPRQPVLDFLLQQSKSYKDRMAVLDTAWKDRPWGRGWAWEDYDAGFMPEKSSLPVYGNVMRVSVNPLSDRQITDTVAPQLNYVRLFKTQDRLFDTLLNERYYLISRENLLAPKPHLRIRRGLSGNTISFEETKNEFSDLSLPFVTNGSSTALWILSDTLKTQLGLLNKVSHEGAADRYRYFGADAKISTLGIPSWSVLHSRPTDSLLRPMMHQSDNFFAEQSLLMVSNRLRGVMNGESAIDTLLQADFRDLPQKPRWVDGSGLSRYNLFTPRDLVTILDKMQREFGMARLKTLFPTGGEGTLGSAFLQDSGSLFAKTGSLSGIVALSGYLYTRKGRLLLFSVLVNNHMTTGTAVRGAVAQFLQQVRQRY
ncbi:D-alanyl-D-alanine carboxypeptidase [Paraflavisolibacter sp. H34]|uniref:D-alanyl-D-alanine carboxypeptidase/D-alanyl-D-alanine-endopeptidase n=1 Tax=Huijunlia imazamoxiresistens TaxID=3127457 RepID=UPI0030175BE7